MMKHFINILILCVGIVINVDAQTFTQRLQTATKSGAKVTIHQDKAIDELVNGAQNTVQKKVTPVQNNQQVVDSHKQESKPAEKKERTTTKPQETEVQPVDTASLAKKSSGYKITGYRVQVYAGGNSRKDKQKAEQTGSQLRALFPLESVYVHFYSPRWICRVGNYRTYEEAHQMLQEVKKLGYSAATIVKGKITVQY